MVRINDTKPRFTLGQTVATPGALEALETSGQAAAEFLQRHLVLDPGDLNEEDQQTNEEAITSSERVFSSYLLNDGTTKIWVITEADRSSTCLLLPEEY